MIFRETALEGAFIIEPELKEDDRGFFARAWCQRELAAHGLNPNVVQANLSYNRHRHTLRGMHYQRPPQGEAKLVRCIRGAIYDVIVDLRKGSPTYRKWVGLTLSAQNRHMLYVPEGFAHGFQTLEDDTELFYLMTEFHTPGSEAGARWDDPAFGIRWPDASTRIMSDRDRKWPLLESSDGQTVERGAKN
jgi:dTDP-4-dehydrorhamnose 3,5-epimerase